jgi:hypothetical protein
LALTADRLDEVRRHLDKAVSFNHLARFDWRRQTDCVQQAFIAARLFADCGTSAIFVDGHINDFVKVKALDDPRVKVKAFFNRRFHDLGFKFRRIIYFDTLATRSMGKRGSGRHRLHFHAIFELPPGWTKADLQRLLENVFGKAAPMGQRQFHFSKPRWDQHHTHNEVQVNGPLGKLTYAMAHAGTTYHNLDLNDGKRSRSSPASRGRCNRKASALARGIPSNFNAEIVFCDHVSKRAGKEAFEAWVKSEQAMRRPQKTPESPPVSAAQALKHRAAG